MIRILVPITVVLLALVSSCSNDQREKEKFSVNVYSDERHAVLGRGIISYVGDRDHVLLTWRLFPEDPKEVFFNIYRKESGEGNENYKWIARTDRTSYIDTVHDARKKKYVYAVRQFHGGQEGKLSRESIPLSSIKGKLGAMVFDVGEPYKQGRVVTGDLNGDGEPEVVVAYSGYRLVDPDVAGGAWSKSEDTIKVAAFLPTGERLWKLDLGSGIEAGPTYQPMVVWDLDADGRAEVILKTNKSADPLDYEEERITVLDGMSGKIKKEAQWPTFQGLWSDYNNDSRNYLAIAHLDGKDPYLIVARGIYKTQKICAFDKDLKRVWERNIGLDHYYPSGLRERLKKFWAINDKLNYLWGRFTKNQVVDKYRGAHHLPIVDIDNDGKEEILWGERCIGQKGKDLWSITEKIPYSGHPDVVFAGDILPSHEGKEIFYGREGWREKEEKIGVFLADDHGKILWARWGYRHIDAGWVGKVVTDQEGMQCFAVDIEEKEWSKAGAKAISPSALLLSSRGILLGKPQVSWYRSFPVDWNGDGVREICVMENGEVQKYDGTVMEKLDAKSLWGADLFGDRKEEIVAAPGDGKIYILFNASVIDVPARVTPMADRQYKNDLSRTAMDAVIIPMEGGDL